VAANEWTTAHHAHRYLRRANQFPHRTEGERVLLAHVPREVCRVLDLGTGDGRLLGLLRVDRDEMLAVGTDSSELMLGAACTRFAGDEHVELVKHDLAEPLPTLGRFDAVVSSFAIHHLEHERKRSLYGEVFDLLEPGGVFANFEHVASPTHRLHVAFFAAIGEPLTHEDRLTVCSTWRASSHGCEASASTTSPATGSDLRCHFCSASSPREMLCLAQPLRQLPMQRSRARALSAT
jgi:tRNA (cmo5U34)-methyltransferase